ncbi:MAG: phosphotransferase [Candidatus Nanohaloarchaea archaeon]|nr:phosphotransferase [Candidatus Nanohaloarchaea archaeon]
MTDSEDGIDPALRRQVETALGARFDWHPLEEGLNDIYRLTGREDTYLCKVYATEDVDLGRFRAEPRIYELVNRETDVPGPEIIHRSLSQDPDRLSFYIMEHIDGENPYERKDELSEDDLSGMLRQYGRMLGSIHSNTSFDRHGVLIGNADGLGFMDDTANWQESLHLKIERMQDLIQERYQDPPDLYLDANLPQLEATLDGSFEPVLLHQDNRLENLLVQDDRITGFLDWSHVRAGHSEYDLARAEYLLLDWDLDDQEKEVKQRLRDSLLDGYSEEHGLDRDDAYRERRQFYRYVTVLWLVAGFPNWSSDWSQERQKAMRQSLERRLQQEKPV